MKCEDCRWSRDNNRQGYVECHKMLPLVRQANADFSQVSAYTVEYAFWPLVKREDFCGEFLAKGARPLPGEEPS